MDNSLDCKAKSLLAAIAAANLPPIYSIPLEKARLQVEGGMARMNVPVQPVHKVCNFGIDLGDVTVPVRVYYPEPATGFDPDQSKVPALIFFHGGGWVFFTLDSYDSLCTHLCTGAGAVVISIDYRRSPEFKFPVPVNDCMNATVWILEHAKQLNIFSEHFFWLAIVQGANLAAVISMKFRAACNKTEKSLGPFESTDQENKDIAPLYTHIAGQVLIYPVTDYYKNAKPSHSVFDYGYGISMNDMRWFWEQYIDDEKDADNHYAAPLLADDHKGEPPALIIVSGCDPLRDEGILYAHQLESFGVETKLSVYHGMIHGFMSYIGILQQAYPAIDEISSWIRAHI